MFIKLKILLLGLLCSLPFALFFGYGAHFFVSHIHEFSESNISYYIGTFIFGFISFTGLTNPGTYIAVFKVFGFFVELGEIASAISIFNIFK